MHTPRVPKSLPTILVVLLASVAFAIAVLGFAACSTQGHTTTTVTFAALAAGATAFFAAPLDGLIAIGLSLLVALGVIAFSPKYPLEPARTPAGKQTSDAPTDIPGTPPHLHNEKAFLDKTWMEVLRGW